jgi:hypothetical protein
LYQRLQINDFPEVLDSFAEFGAEQVAREVAWKFGSYLE